MDGQECEIGFRAWSGNILGRYRRVGTVSFVVMAWWLVLGSVILLMLPTPFLSSQAGASMPVRGQTMHIYQPGIPDWPIPVERAAFDLFQRGTRESDEDAINRAFTDYEWLPVSHGQRVLIVDVDRGVVQVELREGPHTGRTGWLQARNLKV